MRAEASDRVFFAEFAEALGISTLDVVGAVAPSGAEGEVVVFFTPDIDANVSGEEARATEVFSAAVERDADGIYVRKGEPVSRGTLAELLREAGF